MTRACMAWLHSQFASRLPFPNKHNVIRLGGISKLSRVTFKTWRYSIGVALAQTR